MFRSVSLCRPEYLLSVRLILWPAFGGSQCIDIPQMRRDLPELNQLDHPRQGGVRRNRDSRSPTLVSDHSIDEIDF